MQNGKKWPSRHELLSTLHVHHKKLKLGNASRTHYVSRLLHFGLFGSTSFVHSLLLTFSE